MALTVLDCWADNGVLEAARDELASAVAVREGDPRTT
jgi:hypothetical protein